MPLFIDFVRLTRDAVHRKRAGGPSSVVLAALVAGGLAAAHLPAPAVAQIQIPSAQGDPIQAPPAQGQQTQGQQPVPQAPAAPPGTPFGAWTQRCTPNPPPGSSPPAAGQQEVCFLVQQVADPQTQRPVMKVTIGHFEPGRQVGAVIVMPLGVPLARGLQIGVDGKNLGSVPFEVCRRDGCQAFLPMNADVVSAFKAGSQATVVVQSSQGAALNLALSLRGFTAGFNSLN
jgi:invasion protein IalB